MKCLALALLLCAQLHVLLGDGGCYKLDVPPDATECQDPVDLTMHAIGDFWRNSACQDCTCKDCCNGFITPVSFPDDCKVEFIKEECNFKVFKKNDPTESCPVFKAIWK
ncbi:hypothetical protein SKAU_G00008400 [Synaphobranchus kaupii]|uniref:Beta-microseminoprotein n=1 Tax=Synaphobranchus kaupii TaxID=118154 RepID=A0A9Q1G9P1_SYNKA|nr:hypothetical protein SKAU_G00008400 [Synaphobranchus kaupii]